MPSIRRAASSPQRFDFKDTGAAFELEDLTVTMSAPAEFQLKQMLEILKLKVAKRGIDVACLEVKDPMSISPRPSSR